MTLYWNETFSNYRMHIIRLLFRTQHNYVLLVLSITSTVYYLFSILKQRYPPPTSASRKCALVVEYLIFGVLWKVRCVEP